jgi:hypothetical protein
MALVADPAELFAMICYSVTTPKSRRLAFSQSQQQQEVTDDVPLQQPVRHRGGYVARLTDSSTGGTNPAGFRLSTYPGWAD